MKCLGNYFFNISDKNIKTTGLTIKLFLMLTSIIFSLGCSEPQYSSKNSSSDKWRANFKSWPDSRDNLDPTPNLDLDDSLESDLDDSYTELNADSDPEFIFADETTDKQIEQNGKLDQDQSEPDESVKIKKLYNSSHTNLKPDEYFRSYQDVLNSHIISITLKEIISNNGKSKNYKDLLSLDGGTVGIAHFASGGLADLYRHMNTKKYFGYDQNTMISKYSSRCQTLDRQGHSKGCFGIGFWHKGMKNFLAASESEEIQNNAFFARNRRIVESVFAKGWHYSYQIMVAISVANSLGLNGLHKLASKHHWNANLVLKHYSKLSKHKNRRANLITAYLSSSRDKNGTNSNAH
jgi:hypothetical protein